jgi:hypothetical protein
MKFKVNTIKKLNKQMVKLSKKEKGVFTVSVVFGTAFVKQFKFPSQIGSAQIDDSPVGAKGFWTKGKFVPFTEDFIQSKNKVDKKKKRSVFGGG